MATAAPPSQRWLFGPASDLLLGCGLLYVVFFLAAAASGRGLLASSPSYLLPLLVMLVSMPHYGGTLVRVYEQRQSRRAYAIFAVWASLVVFAWFVAGIHDAWIGAVMLTVYITWSPWHYTGQNYGLAMMFLYRRGVGVTPALKRWIYASFVLSFALAFLTMHGSSYGQTYGPQSYTDQIRFLPLGIPYAAGSVLIPLVAAAYVTSLLVAGAMLVRRASSPRDLVPTAALVVTQAIWFSVPMALLFWNVQTGIDPFDGYTRVQNYILVIALAHAAQYLWVTTYYARASDTWHGYGSYLGKVLLAGMAIWTLPAILFAPDAMGTMSYAGGLSLLIAAGVNIHHFILDGAIWKLRSGPIANVLIRSGGEQGATPAPERPWLRKLVWSACAACVAAALFAYWQEEFHVPSLLRSQEIDGARASLDRMAWIGRDNGRARYVLGRAYSQQGRSDDALAQYRRAIALAPNGSGYLQVGALLGRDGEWEAALDTFDQGLVLQPNHVGLLGGASRAALELGRRERAIDLLVRALGVPDADLDPRLRSQANNLAWRLATTSDAAARDGRSSVRIAEAVLAREGESPDPNVLDTVAAAYASAGRYEDAVRTASRAVELAAQRGDAKLGRVIEQRLALYRSGQPYVDPAG